MSRALLKTRISVKSSAARVIWIAVAVSVVALVKKRLASMKAQVIQAFRWIAVLPGAVIAFAIAQILVILGGLFTPDFFVQLAGAWACPIAFVIAGVYIAPKFKFVVALVLTALMVAMMSVTIFWALYTEHIPGDVNKWWCLFTCIVGLVAPIWFCAKLHHDDEEGLLSE